AGFRLEQNALVPVLDNELRAGLPSMGRSERLRKNDLALCRQFRRLSHGKIASKMIAGCQKSFKPGSGRSNGGRPANGPLPLRVGAQTSWLSSRIATISCATLARARSFALEMGSFGKKQRILRRPFALVVGI
ncbi:MAG: hypothetical protein WCA22_07445, partial [Candidatus Binatus sp.]